MVNKTARQNLEMVLGIIDIMERNPRIEKESEAITYAFRTAAADIRYNCDSIDWEATGLLDFKDVKNSDIEFADTRSISVEEDDLKILVDNFRDKTGVKKVQFAYLARLCILYTRQKLRKRVEDENEATIEVQNVDGVALIQKFAELLQANDGHSKNKVQQIKGILGD